MPAWRTRLTNKELGLILIHEIRRQRFSGTLCGIMSLESFLTPLSLSDDQLPKLAISLSHTYRSLAKVSTEQFLATPINVLPNGTEMGKMLAIDVGGSNLRVGFVDLLGSSQITRSYDRSWRIGEDVRKGSGADLFGWIGARIAEVVKTCQEDLQGKGQEGLEEMVPMGITWSFPLKYGTVSPWCTESYC